MDSIKIRQALEEPFFDYAFTSAIEKSARDFTVPERYLWSAIKMYRNSVLDIIEEDKQK